MVVDPKCRNVFHFGGATVIEPNRRELEAALGAAVDLDDPQSLPTTLQRLGVEHLLLTLGNQGMLLIHAAAQILQYLPSRATSTTWLVQVEPSRVILPRH